MLLDGGTLIARIESFIHAEQRAGRDLGFYKEVLPEWSPLLVKVVDGSADPDEIRDLIFKLKALGALMDQEEPDEEIDLEALERAANELANLVDDDPQLPKELRRYCFAVIHQIRREIQDHYDGRPFDIQACSDRLLAATNYLVVQYSDNPAKQNFLSQIWQAIIGANRFGKEIRALAENSQDALSMLPPGAGG